MKGWIGLLVMAALFAAPLSGRAGAAEPIGTLHGRGIITGQVEAPGPGGSRRLYRLYEYEDSTFDLVAFDEKSGNYTTISNPTQESGGVMLAARDGSIFIGTRPHAHILRYDPRTGAIADLGRLGGESYVWSLAQDENGNLYAGTYPSAKLFRISESSNQISDLGRLSDQQYVRTLAVQGGFVYAGVGSTSAQVVAYNIATGRHRRLLTGGAAGFATVESSPHGVIASVAGHSFKIRALTASPLRSAPRLLESQAVFPQNPAIDSQYPGKTVAIFKFAAAPDGNIYGSSILPAYLFRFEPQTSSLENLGYIGGGEVYSLLSEGRRLVMAAYYGMAKAPILLFDPSAPYENGKNPRLQHFPGEDAAWRPWAMAAAPDGIVYIGSQPSYGELGGMLVAYDPANGHVTAYNDVVPDQSIESLTVSGKYLVGGTNVEGGTGAKARDSQSKLFLWDTAGKRKVFETVPVPGSASITDLAAAPSGIVFGISGSQFFAFDPQSRQVLHTERLTFGGVLPNCVQAGPDGALWGLSRSGIFRIDPATQELTFITRVGVPVTAGMAIVGRDIYFASGATMYRYVIPSNYMRK